MKGCPKCKAENYVGRNIQGMVTWTCRTCGNQWHGGLPQEPQDPTVPLAPTNPMDQPTIQFIRDKHGEAKELRKRVNLTQEFRKGMPIPEGED
jgi:hypothetical protein